MTRSPAELGAWELEGTNAASPLRIPLFRALWSAALVSNIGNWMQNVAAAWLMMSLTSSPIVIALVHIHHFHSGAIKLVADHARRVLIGATLVTPRAGEILGELVLAIKLRTP